MNLKRTLIAGLLVCGVLAVSGAAAAADSVIFLVRHAERADQAGGPPPGGTTMATDPPLSTAGHERAKRLASILASSEIKHIFITEFQRTRQTAAPLAEKIGVQPVASQAGDPAALTQQVLKASGSVLIVGHSNTVPDLLKRLGVQTPISIGDTEFDNLFIVVRPATGEPTLIRLRY